MGEALAAEVSQGAGVAEKEEGVRRAQVRREWREEQRGREGGKGCAPNVREKQ